MKKIIIALLLFVFSNNAYSQDTIHYPKEGFFDYALIEKNKFYISQRPSLINKAEIIRCVRLDKKSIPIRHSCAGSKNPKLSFNWVKSNELLFEIAHINTETGITSRIYYREFETRDSVEVSKQEVKGFIQVERVFIKPVHIYFRSFFEEYPYYVENEVINNIIDSLSFDLYTEDGNIMEIFMRDKDAFYIWEATLPPKGSRDAEWHIKEVYAAPNYDEDYIPRFVLDYYSGKKPLHNAITDSLFFDGHFKVIVQDNEKFLINREHANIYHIGPENINRIGSVDSSKDYSKIRGKRYFIENRDENHIIFFAPVNWEDTNLPKPRIRVMSKEEMQEKFRHVVE